ncbi:MAG TPA: GlsB/YeaQ/YmgE family stress response membrane protein [Thermoclostridium sp.]|nr:GlsB/YeaQ/YmgE family stress response membrane protein [Thermoclostridium sp.]
MSWNIIIWLVLGALAGWLASKIMGTKGGLLRNIILGVVGSLLGGFIAGLIGISAKTVSLGGILIAVAGACLVIVIARRIAR